MLGMRRRNYKQRQYQSDNSHIPISGLAWTLNEVVWLSKGSGSCPKDRYPDETEILEKNDPLPLPRVDATQAVLQCWSGGASGITMRNIGAARATSILMLWHVVRLILSGAVGLQMAQ